MYSVEACGDREPSHELRMVLRCFFLAHHDAFCLLVNADAIVALFSPWQRQKEKAPPQCIHHSRIKYQDRNVKAYECMFVLKRERKMGKMERKKNVEEAVRIFRRKAKMKRETLAQYFWHSERDTCDHGSHIGKCGASNRIDKLQ